MLVLPEKNWETTLLLFTQPKQSYQIYGSTYMYTSLANLGVFCGWRLYELVAFTCTPKFVLRTIPYYMIRLCDTRLVYRDTRVRAVYVVYRLGKSNIVSPKKPPENSNGNAEINSKKQYFPLFNPPTFTFTFVHCPCRPKMCTRPGIYISMCYIT